MIKELHASELALLSMQLPLPCVLKQADSAFSRGVAKADTPEEILTSADYRTAR